MISRTHRLLIYHRPAIEFAAIATRYFSMSSERKALVAVCQINVTNKKEDNFRSCSQVIKTACRHEVKMIFLPEACDYMGETKNETVELAEPLDGPLVTRFQELAKKYGVWLSLGGIHEKTDQGKVSNSHVVIDDKGDIKTVYRKVHLFDVDIPETGVSIKESDFVLQGEKIISPIETPVGKVGLGICYDMRFPEFSLSLTNMGAEILTFPSAFTFATGSAHWEVLLRARAIESQCYVIAAAQVGSHNKKRTSWGHAMIVDPWGNIIAQCSDGVGCAVAELDHTYIVKARTSMPVQRHRRNDLYPKLLPIWRITFPDQESYIYGQSIVKAGQVFLQTDKSIGFTNIKCVVPGHVLVSPRKCVKRVCDLSHEELTDLFICVQEVQKAVEKKYGATSTTITVQDGPDAGQTISHVHVHILPRKPGDMDRDKEINVVLEKEGARIRTYEEMQQEAEELRTYFYGSTCPS